MACLSKIPGPFKQHGPGIFEGQASCQDFAQRGPWLMLAQDDLDMSLGKQREKTPAHVASPRVYASQTEALQALAR